MWIVWGRPLETFLMQSEIIGVGDRFVTACFSQNQGGGSMISSCSLARAGNIFSVDTATRRAGPVGKVPGGLRHASQTYNLLLVRIMIAILPYHIFENNWNTSIPYLCMFNRPLAPTKDSVNSGRALVMTRMHWYVNVMFSRVSNLAKGLQLFLWLS